MRVAIGFDHRGVPLRAPLLEALAAGNHEVVDVGTHKPRPRVDFPVKGAEVGDLVAGGAADRGVLVCGSGVGTAIAACKVPGVRASVCHDSYSARQGVEHEDMNVLCLGAAIVGESLAVEILQAFLGATFDSKPRYLRRLEQIARLERRVPAPDRDAS